MGWLARHVNDAVLLRLLENQREIAAIKNKHLKFCEEMVERLNKLHIGVEEMNANTAAAKDAAREIARMHNELVSDLRTRIEKLEGKVPEEPVG
jgi:cell division septum initiation protein DivIVA